jgi:tetratricopeptide (TPR) repeat protein
LLAIVVLLMPGYLTPPAVAEMQPIIVGGRTLSLPHLAGPEMPSLSTACPPPALLPDPGMQIATACARVAAAADDGLQAAYLSLSKVYLDRGRRSPPALREDATLGGAALVAALRRVQGSGASVSTDWHTELSNAGVRMRQIADVAGDPSLFELAVDAFQSAALLCPADERSPCAAEAKLRVVDALSSMGRWRSSSADEWRAIDLARATLRDLPVDAHRNLWLRLHLRISVAFNALVNLAPTDAEKIALQEQALAELAEPLRVADAGQHDLLWSIMRQAAAATEADLAIWRHDSVLARQAIARCRSAIESYTFEESPTNWAEAWLDVAVLQVRLGQLGEGPGDYAAAVSNADRGIAALQRLGLPQRVAYARMVRAFALVGDGEERWTNDRTAARERLREARAELDAVEPLFVRTGNRVYASRIHFWRNKIEAAEAKL